MIKKKVSRRNEERKKSYDEEDKKWSYPSPDRPSHELSHELETGWLEEQGRMYVIDSLASSKM